MLTSINCAVKRDLSGSDVTEGHVLAAEQVGRLQSNIQVSKGWIKI